jgi:hypothetical protein
MRKAILIGFEYENGKKLPGIAVDLYLVYWFLKKKGWGKDEIVVFTDIKIDHQTEVLKTAILEKTVNSDILSFIEDLKDKKQYIEFISHNHYNNFDSIFSQFKVDNLFFYYTGHFKEGNIILPNQSLISLEGLTKILTKYSEVISIMDCCNGGITLPFNCHEKVYRFENENFVKAKIISFASSLENEKSLTSRAGSLFTRNILSILSDDKLNIYQILEKIKKTIIFNNQTANISSSYPSLHYIFPWVYSFPNISISQNPYFISIFRNS